MTGAAAKGRFLSPADRKRVQDAIAAAERLTSGEIRLRVQPRCSGDPRADAESWFVRLGMSQTADRNGALIFVAWQDRQFAIVGDTGIHERVGAAFWRAAADTLTSHFAAGEFAAGLQAAVLALGEALATHFPRANDDANELSDEISEE